MEQAKTINIDGQTFDVSKFSQGVQQAVTIYSKLNQQLLDQQFEVLKTQSAMQQVGGQISDAIKKELAEQEKPANDEDVKEAEEVS